MNRNTMPQSQKPMKRTPLRKRKPNWKDERAKADAWRKAVDDLHGTGCLLWRFSYKRCLGQVVRHHIYAKGSHPHLKYEPLNGIPVCELAHHREAHRDMKAWRETILANLLTPEQRAELEAKAAARR